MNIHTTTREFPLGRLLATPRALKTLRDACLTVQSLLSRHAAGDWGDLDDEDRALNDQAVNDGTRIFSAYEIAPNTKVWIITEADRSATTILLPDEY